MEILSIPFQNTIGRDNLVWQENSSNNFTVKSTYQVALRLQDKAQSEHSWAGLDRPIWRKIWKLNAPPKVRNFLWQVCSNILPTWENLHRCKMQVDLNMYCESARWPKMYGRYVEEKFKMPKCSSQVLFVQANGGQT